MHPDQALHCVWDQASTCSISDSFPEEFFKMLILKKNSRQQNKHENFPGFNELSNSKIYRLSELLP